MPKLTNERLDRLFSDSEPRTNERGNEVRKIFLPGDRYFFDFNLDLGEWWQFDTDQDASYFGIWVNRARRCTLSYCEGDIYLVTCPTEESYDREILSKCEFHSPGAAFSTIDSDGTLTRYYEERARFFYTVPEGFSEAFDNEAAEGNAS